MSVDVVSEIDIDRPLEVVADFSADPDNVKKWYKNIHRVEWKTERPATLGSQIAFVARFLGRDLAYTYEILEFESNAKLTMRTAKGPFPMETTYTWVAKGSSTHMTLRNRGEPKGFSRVLAPLMSFAMKNAMDKDLRQLKLILEKNAD